MIEVDTRQFVEDIALVESRMGDVGVAVRSKVLNQTMREILKPLHRYARTLVPKGKTRNLHRSLKIKIKEYADPAGGRSTWLGIVGNRTRKGAHGHNVEFGHRISWRHYRHGGKLVKQDKDNPQGALVKTMNYTKPVLYMRRAIIKHRQRMIDKLEAKLGDLAVKEWQK